jgi:hypothetical protein
MSDKAVTQLGRFPPRLILKMNICELLAVVVADDEAR